MSTPEVRFVAAAEFCSGMEKCYANYDLAKHLSRNSDIRLLKSLDHLVHQAISILNGCEKAISIKIELARELLVASDQRLSASLYAIHAIMLRSVRNSQQDRFCSATNRLVDMDFFSSPFEILPNWIEGREGLFGDIISTINEDSITSYKKEMALSPPSSAAYANSSQNLQFCLGVISKLPPFILQELAIYVRQFMIYKFDYSSSFSSFSTLGLVSLHHLRAHHNWTTYFDSIIHEGAHQHLYHLMAHHRLVENEGNFLVESALRTEPRPLSGIYHGMFVMTRIIIAFSLLLELPWFHNLDIPIVPAESDKKTHDTYFDKFFKLCETLHENAQLSSLGVNLLNECEMCVNNIRRNTQLESRLQADLKGRSAQATMAI